MSRRTFVRTGILLVVIVLLPATACSSRKSAAFRGAVPPSPATSGLPVATPDPSPSGQPAGDGGQPHTGPQSSTGSTTAPVDVQVTLITFHFNTNVLYTPACPYDNELQAHIVVDRATDLTYQFKVNGANMTPEILLHVKAGTTAVRDASGVTALSLTPLHDEVVVRVLGGRTVNAVDDFSVMCIPSAGPVSASPAKAVCPYGTIFSVTVTTGVGPMTSAYKWIFEDNSVVTGTVTFPGMGLQSQTVSVKRILQLGSKGVSAAFQPNEHAKTTTSATATCF